MNIGFNIDSTNLSYRLLEQRDLERARSLHNDESTLLQLTNIEHVSEKQQQRWFEALSISNSSRRYVVEHGQSFVGVFRVDALDVHNRSVQVGLDIVQMFRGKRLSYPIYEHFFSYFFDQMGLNRIHLKVLETNECALHVYKKLGFIIEGRDRKAIFRNGDFRDYICMSILRDEWLKRSSR